MLKAYYVFEGNKEEIDLTLNDFKSEDVEYIDHEELIEVIYTKLGYDYEENKPEAEVNAKMRGGPRDNYSLEVDDIARRLKLSSVSLYNEGKWLFSVN